MLDRGYSKVKGVSIYDVTGRLVKSFNHLTIHQSSINQVVWFGDDKAGQQLPAGVYFVCIHFSNQTVLKKVVRHFH
ncbi:MAG: T9SS type A sorting domain-containing protein [bacterium]